MRLAGAACAWPFADGASGEWLLAINGYWPSPALLRWCTNLISQLLDSAFMPAFAKAYFRMHAKTP
jgi:hypothetical protein